MPAPDPNKTDLALCVVVVALVVLWVFLINREAAKQRLEHPLKQPEKESFAPAPVESTCPNSNIECHWQVRYCEEWWDAPTDCAIVGPATPDVNYGTVSWKNYYCACDMKCHPEGECKNGKAFDMVQDKCSAKYGWPECPEGAFQCYWQSENESNVHCPVPKCCGGWCSAWNKC